MSLIAGVLARRCLFSHTGGHSPGYALGRRRLRRRICLQRNTHLSKTKSMRRSVPRLICVQCMTNGANHDSQCKTIKSRHSEFIQPGLHKNQTIQNLRTGNLLVLVFSAFFSAQVFSTFFSASFLGHENVRGNLGNLLLFTHVDC